MSYRGTRVVKVELAAEAASEEGVREALDECEAAMADALAGAGIDAGIYDSGSTRIEGREDDDAEA